MVSKSKGDDLEIFELEEMKKGLEKTLTDEQALVIDLRNERDTLKGRIDDYLEECGQKGVKIAELEKEVKFIVLNRDKREKALKGEIKEIERGE